MNMQQCRTGRRRQFPAHTAAINRNTARQPVAAQDRKIPCAQCTCPPPTWNRLTQQCAPALMHAAKGKRRNIRHPASAAGSRKMNLADRPAVRMTFRFGKQVIDGQISFLPLRQIKRPHQFLYVLQSRVVRMMVVYTPSSLRSCAAESGISSLFSSPCTITCTPARQGHIFP